MPSEFPPTRCRGLFHPPSPGPWNMAVDEVLWRRAERSGECSWRFYRWSEPTLSLGYFQAYDDRHRHEASASCAVVRRLSGGGAILHDQELTYSFVVPAGHPLAVRRLRLYRAVHTALIESLARIGVEASLCGEAENPAPTSQPFLCFQRRSAGDVLVGQAKIAGSAQRRSRGAVLQHGSVLIGRSQYAPELDALEDFTAEPLSHDRLRGIWFQTLGPRLGLGIKPGTLTESEREQALELVETKYAADQWTRHRGR